MSLDCFSNFLLFPIASNTDTLDAWDTTVNKEVSKPFSLSEFITQLLVKNKLHVPFTLQMYLNQYPSPFSMKKQWVLVTQQSIHNYLDVAPYFRLL